ncbi:MAG: hypothetical protein KA795_14865 [Burkholderiaceae bacterium]|nr:hypothetical protein [Burkholderiaceae bacterium]
MENGHYRIVFTTTSGTLGEGACLIRNGHFVGADFLHHYHGDIRSEGGVLDFPMHCARHTPEIVSQLGLPLQFELHWKGRETDQGFVLEALLPGGVVLNASCTWLAA